TDSLLVSEKTLIAGKIPLCRPRSVTKLVLPVERFWTPPVSVTVPNVPEGAASGVSPSDVNVTLSVADPAHDPLENPSPQKIVAVTMSLMAVVPGSRSAIVAVRLVTANVAPSLSNTGPSVTEYGTVPPSANANVRADPICRVSEDATGPAKASVLTIGNAPRARALARPSFAPMNLGDREAVMRRPP